MTAARHIERGKPRSTLQAVDAFRVIAAVLLDPLQAAIAVCRLVGGELVGAGLPARLVEILLSGIFRRDRRGEYRGGFFLSADVAAEIDIGAALQFARDLGFQESHVTG